jgi:mannitol-1-phosphate 5-dehydrogenase
MKKIVIFGAGKIGRSFIGPLFANAGYHVVFVDIDRTLINEINRKGFYNVIHIKEERKIVRIDNISGVLATDSEQVAKEIAGAELLAMSAGPKALPAIVSLIAQGILRRFEESPELPLDIIIAENLRNASEIIHDLLKEKTDPGFPVESYVGLVETSVGKMVPIMSKQDMSDDMLQIYAEPYNTLILDRKGFLNPVPDVPGLAPKENIKAWVDRKSFIHNLGHVACAYLGFVSDPGYTYIYEVLENEQNKTQVRETMLEAAAILLSMYPDVFTMNDLTEHIDNLIDRFENRSLKDTVFRVGMDLHRKLGPEDRLAGAIRAGIRAQKPVNRILYTLVCGTFFRACDENGDLFEGDEKFIAHFNKGPWHVLKEICGFDDDIHPGLFTAAREYHDKIALSTGSSMAHGS